eukprot:3819591-Rhodomonas_salina.2
MALTPKLLAIMEEEGGRVLDWIPLHEIDTVEARIAVFLATAKLEMRPGLRLKILDVDTACSTRLRGCYAMCGTDVAYDHTAFHRATTYTRYGPTPVLCAVY